MIYIKKILQKYSLPSIPDLLNSMPSKSSWKHQVKKAVIKKVAGDIAEEALSKSTLKYLHAKFTMNQSHHAVNLPGNPREVTRSNIKIRLLTGTYTLQASQQVFGKVTSDICQMCGTDTENTRHFLLDCVFLEKYREIYTKQINFTIPYVYIHRHTLTADQETFTQLLLDPSHPTITTLVDLTPQILDDLDYITVADKVGI